ncbi:MAG: T9SS type A sorting domain-containing protein [Bacteroidota bacterium]
MKKNLIPILALVSTLYSIKTTAQTIVNNGGFEQWTVGHPNSWTSSNFLDITQTTDKNGGTYAAKLSDATGDNHSYLTTTSLLAAGEHPTYASCYFKFGNFIQGNYAMISISLINTSLQQEAVVASQTINTNVTTYTPLVFSFSPAYTSYVPDPTSIKIEIVFYGYGTGSEFFVDDFGYEANTATSIIDESFKSSFDIYPNPSNGKFIVSNESSTEITSIEIFNLLGERVSAVSGGMNKEQEIDMSKKGKGSYFVRIYTKTSVYSRAIVVQ